MAWTNRPSGATAQPTGSDRIDLEIDITGDVCPMTFVRTRLALDRLAAGQVLLVHLHGEEPRRNVPRTAQEQGHEILALNDLPSGATELILRKA